MVYDQPSTLTGKPIAWVHKFIDADGINVLADALSHTSLLHNRRGKDDTAIQQEVIACFKAILNVDGGADALLRKPDAIRNIALILDSDHVQTRGQCIFLLAIICSWSVEGYNLTLEAFNHYKVCMGNSGGVETHLHDFVTSWSSERSRGSTIWCTRWDAKRWTTSTDRPCCCCATRC